MPLSESEVWEVFRLMADMDLETAPPSHETVAQWRRFLERYTISDVRRGLDHWVKNSASRYAPRLPELLNAIGAAGVSLRRPQTAPQAERPVTPEKLLQQMRDARVKYPHLFDGRPVPEFPPGTSAEDIGKAMVRFLTGASK